MADKPNQENPMTATARPIPATPSSSRAPFGDIRARVAGLGALTFVAVVVFQNLLRGATAPANGASGDEVLRSYTDHRAVTFILVTTFVISGLGLAVFLGGALRRLLAGARSGWAV